MINENSQKLLKDYQSLVDYDINVALTQEGLKIVDYIEICRRLNRPPNRTELGMFGVMWSEHCCYRNSIPLLKKFPTKGPRILVGPGENAGVVDIGDGERLVFKIESHNHPSAIEPFQGAATGVGGILRDIFTMGARPIALLNALRFGPIEEENNISLMEGVVSGIAHYGNCVGVPTVGGEVSFNKSYSGNPLVNAMALGLMETKEIVCSGAEGVDNPVIYVGSTTGRDGMGGASFASSQLSNSSIDNRPAVQVGDPFLEKGLIEACLEVFKSGLVVAAQDMGAAGLTCSSSEMAAKGKLGIEIDLDLVPAREEGMTAYEFLLSESQERMLLVVKPNKQQEVMDKFMKWGLKASVVGKVLKKNIVRIIHKGLVVAELPASALAEETPIESHSLIEEPPLHIQELWKWREDKLPKANQDGIDVLIDIDQFQFFSWNNVLLKLLDDPTIASKRWIYQQYDYQVQGNTVLCPGDADAAVIRLRSQEEYTSEISSNRGIAVVVDCPNRWVYLDPERGTMAAVAEAARNVSCVGAEPLAVTNNLNFSSPESPIGYWQLALACQGLSKACIAFDTPITGGNVSLYNETRLKDGSILPIHPTPVVGLVGIIEDLSKVKNLGWVAPGDLIFLLGVPIETCDLGDERVSLAGSSYLEVIHGSLTGRPPEIDLKLEKGVQLLLKAAFSIDCIQSAHDISDGGIAIAMAESCISSGLGAHFQLPNSNLRLDRLLFAEGGARVLISLKPEQEKILKNLLSELNHQYDESVCATKIGTVTSNNELLITQMEKNIVELSISDLKQTFEDSIPQRIQKHL